jgi:broad specificity phosphatase PhoE
MSTVYFITHPDVVIDPAVPVQEWPLSERGRARMKALAEQNWMSGLRAIYCSTERKATDGAMILAEGLALSHSVVPRTWRERPFIDGLSACKTIRGGRRRVLRQAG